MTLCCIWPATQIKKTSSSIKLELIICFVNLKGIILQHFAFCPPVHYILLIEHRFKTLVSNGKHIYDERVNRSWNGMLFSSKKALLLNYYYTYGTASNIFNHFWTIGRLIILVDIRNISLI
jgi:hypothetical protein